MNAQLQAYAVRDAERIVTPALLIYPELVDDNIRTTLAMVGDDAERWRPHIKTAKLGAIIGHLVEHGIANLKCATTLELLTACRAGADDVLVAFAVTGANARRVLEIAREHPKTQVSVLVESAAQVESWLGTGAGIFVDVNPGMNRTGISPDRPVELVQLAHLAGKQFRGLHWYDGHVSAPDPAERQASAHQGYRRLMEVVDLLQASGIRIEEVITSGTPAAPYGFSFAGFKNAGFVHRISPGTVVYNDLTSLRQLAEFPYRAAAVVLATVISHPLPNQITCDAGHKAVSVDSGVPNCAVIGYPSLIPLKPSEEHLPIEGPAPEAMPKIGEKLYLIPKHVCPTVNNFDDALMIAGGRIIALERVSARGHESPSMMPLA